MKMKFIKFYLLLAIVILNLTEKVKCQEFKIVTYEANDAIFPNPDRGFYRHTEVHSGNYNLLNDIVLNNYRKENITLILRVFYLENFVNGPISNEYLANMEKDFNIIRKAGTKVIVRFAYTLKSSPPYGDAKPAMVISHIKQLAPLLQKNSDVISVVQAGFIGAWGEWYYTDHYSVALGSPNNNDWINRRALMDELLTALPASRMIQVRTPSIKRSLVQAMPAIINSQAYDGSKIARISHHNDCFLASPDDYGTYDNLVEEKKYLEQETNYLSMGGETCNPYPVLSECTNALAEMKRFHWTFLNRSYHPEVLNGWIKNGCFSEVEKKLGYRYRLTSGAYPELAAAGKNIHIQIDIINDGWANPTNERKIALILKNDATNKIYSFDIKNDQRKWEANTSMIIDQVLPNDIEKGTYSLYLNLPDGDNILAENPRFSIRMANKNTYEEASGYNNLLHKITVTDASVSNQEINKSIPISVTPNPFTDIFKIKLENKSEANISIYDTHGNIVTPSSSRQLENEILIDGSNLVNGLYFIKVYSADKLQIVKAIKVQ